MTDVATLKSQLHAGIDEAIKALHADVVAVAAAAAWFFFIHGGKL